MYLHPPVPLAKTLRAVLDSCLSTVAWYQSVIKTYPESAYLSLLHCIIWCKPPLSLTWIISRVPKLSPCFHSFLSLICCQEAAPLITCMRIDIRSQCPSMSLHIFLSAKVLARPCMISYHPLLWPSRPHPHYPPPLHHTSLLGAPRLCQTCLWFQSSGMCGSHSLEQYGLSNPLDLGSNVISSLGPFLTTVSKYSTPQRPFSVSFFSIVGLLLLLLFLSKLHEGRSFCLFYCLL